MKGNIFSSNNHLQESIKPFHEFYDGTFQRYGKYEDDGEFHIHYHATGRYGYEVNPIWAVLFKKDGAWKQYKFFIGEAPHKDDNGEWVTYNKVPTFIMGAFGGGYFIDEEPDIPHIIDIQTDEFRHDRETSKEEASDEMYTEYRKLQYRLSYCTFRDYLHGLNNRLKERFGYFNNYIGEKYEYWMYSNTHKGYFSISFFSKLDEVEKYFQVETEENLRFLHIKENNKWCFRYEKRHNDHVCSAC